MASKLKVDEIEVASASTVKLNSTLAVDTIKDASASNTLFEQSGSDWAWGSGVPSGSIIQTGFVSCTGADVTDTASGWHYATGVTTGTINFTAGNSILVQAQVRTYTWSGGATGIYLQFSTSTTDDTDRIGDEFYHKQIVASGATEIHMTPMIQTQYAPSGTSVVFTVQHKHAGSGVTTKPANCNFSWFEIQA